MARVVRLELDVDFQGAVLKHLQYLLEAWQAFGAVVQADGLKLREGSLSDRASPISRSLQRGVMNHDYLIIRSQMDVKLDPVSASCQESAKAFEGVLGPEVT
ncbi:hypothetical protein GCM10008955_10320 [Deinococcus malanensis]|uniref:Uncharacterized protein n=1 Tax=Deinococcus malanensis TaxID=1706855 RepID=A0ABQ2EP49_9DEIO|nr:hypothetical protein GCM10008955_10320 [Deinococcus malanensis]